MSKRQKTTTDALKILDQMTGSDPEVRKALDEERAKLAIADKIRALRAEAGLSQGDLARRVGTTQSVISRLEAADYGRHSLTMLNRIAAATDRRVEIRFVPGKRRLRAV